MKIPIRAEIQNMQLLTTDGKTWSLQCIIVNGPNNCLGRYLTVQLNPQQVNTIQNGFEVATNSRARFLLKVCMHKELDKDRVCKLCRVFCPKHFCGYCGTSFDGPIPASHADTCSKGEQQGAEA